MIPQIGILGRIRAQLAEWKLAASQSEREARAMEAARQLDADEVGRRADRRRQEREAQPTAEGPSTELPGDSRER